MDVGASFLLLLSGRGSECGLRGKCGMAYGCAAMLWHDVTVKNSVQVAIRVHDHGGEDIMLLSSGSKNPDEAESQFWWRIMTIAQATSSKGERCFAHLMHLHTPETVY